MGYRKMKFERWDFRAIFSSCVKNLLKIIIIKNNGIINYYNNNANNIKWAHPKVNL